MIVISIVAILLTAAVDQVIKFFVASTLPGSDPVALIPGVLDIVYVENRGVAFGLFTDMRWIFIVVTSVIMIFFAFLLFSKKFKHPLFTVSSVLIIGGGLSNLIDRIFFGYVIDYLSLSFFPPVCNLADYCVCIGVALLLVYLLFFSDFFTDKKKLTPKETASNKSVNDDE